MPQESFRADNVVDAFPLSRLQAGMLFHSLYSPETSTYHDIFSFHLQTPFDAKALRGAIDDVIERHPILRTSFNLSQFSEPVQLVHKIVDAPPLRVVDLRRLLPDEQQAVMGDWMERERRVPFDITTAPLLRLQVHWCGEERIRFSLSFHHAILDGWSVAVLLSELFHCYFLRIGQRAPRLVAAPQASFQHFIKLELDAIQSEQQRSFWTAKLSNLPKNAVSRTLRQADSARTVVRHLSAVPEELSTALLQVARSAGVPLKSILLAAHLRVIGVLNNQREVITGIVANGRPEEFGGDRALGLFLNTLPMRFLLSGGSWLELARAAYEMECEYQPFRRYPLTEIRKLCHRQSLFDCVFDFIDFKAVSADSVQGALQLLDSEYYEETNFALMVNFHSEPNSARLQLCLSCDPRIVEIAPDAIAGCYQTALSAIVSAPSSRYDLHPLVSEVERQRVARDWNRTEVQWNGPREIHTLFEAQAARTPESIAVSSGGRSLTYAELNRITNQLAHHLRALGVRSDTLVAVLIERSPEMLVALLGILKAGGAYVPLDPNHPVERNAYVLAETGATLLITQTHLLAPWTAGVSKVVRLDADWDQITAQPAVDASPAAALDHLAYVLYTSGSTGTPKGVMVTRGALANLLRGMARETCVDANTVMAAVTTLSFDIAGLELYLPLMVGGHVILIDRETAADGRLLREQVAGSTIMQSTPVTWRLVLEAGWSGGKGFTALSGGDVLPKELAQRLTATGASVYNLYGPTETTIWSTAQRLSEGDEVTIGRPVANTRVYVLNASLQLVPPGVAGELYIGGAGVARGYLHRPALTAERFVPDPFGPPGGRLYRTGDGVRHRPDGSLEFLGRIDQQVKIRGYRIEPAEVEAALRRHPSVRDTVVAAYEHKPGEKRLIAYVVPDPVQTASAPSPKLTVELREALRTTLPDYMVPAGFMFLDEVPRLPNGKIDHQGLPGFVPAESEQPYVAPRNPTEAAIAEIWAELLGIRQVGVHDDFFALGGDSVLCVQMTARLESTFGVHIPIRTVLLGSILGDFALSVDHALQAARPHQRSEQERVNAFLDSLSDEQVRTLFFDPVIAGELELSRIS